MNCKENRLLISAYVDGELDAKSSLELETHLKSCSVCSARLSAMTLMKEKVKALARTEDLRLPNLAVLKTPRPSRAPYYAAGSVAVVILLGFWLNMSSQSETVSADLIDLHLRSLQARHLVDIASSNHHVVKPWFSGQLSFAFNPDDFKDEGFELLGGRLDVLQRRTVAALVYQHGAHKINLVVGQARQPGILACPSRDGFVIECWENDGLKFYLISDLNPKDLRDLRHLVETAQRK